VTRVLLADDHPFVMAGVEAVLRGSSFQVVAKVADGAEVQVALNTSRPDLLILDVMMPKVNGVDVLMSLRQRGDTRPVVLLTASLDNHRLLAAIKAGVNGIVLKDGAEEILVACLEKVINGGRWIEPSLLQKALDYSLQGQVVSDPLAPLTTRERSIASLVAMGKRNRDIAGELGLTEGTVKVYLHGIYEKLSIDNRIELAVLVSESR
jgi:two-component system nitrate/nitrite response regulator NarP